LRKQGQPPQARTAFAGVASTVSASRRKFREAAW